MKKPEVGQMLWSLNIGNAARHREQVLTPVIVTKVGRKYFSVRREDDKHRHSIEKQYHISDYQQKTEISPDSKLYPDPQEWEDEKETLRLHKKLRDQYFDSARHVRLSLEKLRKIADIIIEV